MPRLQLTQLHAAFDALQVRYGAAGLPSVYGAGCTQAPRCCLLFMNPTARNVATRAGWTGLRAQWLGVKPIWRVLASAGVISDKMLEKILALHPEDWTAGFAQALYAEVAQNGFYITNFAKCTQADARALPDAVFEAYRELLIKELTLLRPQRIVAFGNQVGGLLLKRPVAVSRWEGKAAEVRLGRTAVPVWPTFYPVGLGFRNTPRAVENIKLALKTKVVVRDKLV